MAKKGDLDSLIFGYDIAGGKRKGRDIVMVWAIMVKRRGWRERNVRREKKGIEMLSSTSIRDSKEDL